MSFWLIEGTRDRGKKQRYSCCECMAHNFWDSYSEDWGEFLNPMYPVNFLNCPRCNGCPLIPPALFKMLKIFLQCPFGNLSGVSYSSAIDESLCWGHHLCYNKTSHHIWNATPTPASAYSYSSLLSLLVSCFKHNWIAEMYILNSAALTLFPKVFYLSIRSWKITVLSNMIFL